MKSIGELSALLTIKHGRHIPDWKLRRICARHFPDLPRLAGTRAVPDNLIPGIETLLIAEGWIPAADAAEVPA